MPETGEQQRQRVAENLRRLKAANRPRTEIDQYLASERAVPEKVKQSVPEAIGAGTETFLDALTLGGSGLVVDAAKSAIYDEPFAEMRTDRKERKGQFREDHGGLATALEIAGSLATPLPGAGVARGLKIGGSLVKQAPQTAGWLARTGRVMGDAAAQSGIAGTVGNLDELSLEGAGSALKKGGEAAALGAFIAGGLGSATGVGGRFGSRVKGMKRLDKKAFEIDDRIRKMDAENYGTAMGEATATPPISAILDNDPVIAPIANEIRELARYRGKSLNDAEVADQVYKRLSSNQRAAQDVVNLGDDYRPDLVGELDRLGTAKGKLLDAIEAPSEVTTMGRAVYVPAPSVAGSSAPLSTRDALDRFKDARAKGMYRRADGRAREGETVMQSKTREGLDRRLVEARAPQTTGAPTGGRLVTRESETIPIGAGIPSLRKAIEEKRIAEAGREAFERGGDLGQSIGAGKTLPMKKQLTQSREALLREIPDMSSTDAELMLAGILGRTPEAIRLSNNVLGAFGLLGSAVRLPSQMYRTGEIVRALEAKIGRGKMAQKASDLTRGTLARILGAESQR